MKKTKRIIALSFGALLTFGALGVSAKDSGVLNVFVPRLGQMSSSVGNVEKETSSVPGTMYLNIAPHTYTLYGDYAKPGYSQNANARISDDYYALELRTSVKIYSGDIGSGTNVAGRVGSSNWEIDERYATFSYNPN